MKSNEHLNNLITGFTPKKRKGFQLLLRLLKNYYPSNYTKVFGTRFCEEDLLNILWSLNGNKTSFEDSLFQTLLRNHKLHHLASGVNFVETSNADYKMYARILSSKKS